MKIVDKTRKKKNSIHFEIYRSKKPPIVETHPTVLLFQDSWDDFGHKTLYIATLYISDAEVISLGAVKIAEGSKGFHPRIGYVFQSLSSESFSLGQSVAYYRTLRDRVPKKIVRLYLKAMRDIVAEPDLQTNCSDLGVYNNSLLRDGAARHAIRRGGYYIGAWHETVPPPKFTFEMQVPNASNKHEIDFDFSDYRELPHRITLLVGRNGTGKTTALATLAHALAPGDKTFEEKSLSCIDREASIDPPQLVSRVIAISYNAFDEFPLPRKRTDDLLVSYRSKLSYKYCGLRNLKGEIDVNEINEMMENTLEIVHHVERVDVLESILKKLIGEEAARIICNEDGDRNECFRSLSAGQRLTTAITCDIVGFIEEGSILLVDEPETHLHPGLLSSMIVALQDILAEFDSYAIISTHSPILLQQVPSRFVRVFKRIGLQPLVTSLQIESFGEDLGELCRLSLGLAEQERDFTHVLAELYQKHKNVKSIEQLFDLPLGLPARAYLYSIDEKD